MAPPGQRTCPHCGPEQPLDEVDFKSQMVDRCGNCQGIYFDKGELEAIFSIVEMYTNVALEEPEIDHVPTDERVRDIVCPADGTVMADKNVGGVWLDICTECEGIWVDGGEIAALRIAQNQIQQNLTLYLRLGS